MGRNILQCPQVLKNEMTPQNLIKIMTTKNNRFYIDWILQNAGKM